MKTILHRRLRRGLGLLHIFCFLLVACKPGAVGGIGQKTAELPAQEPSKLDDPIPTPPAEESSSGCMPGNKLYRGECIPNIRLPMTSDGLDPYYKKLIHIDGAQVASNEKVADEALSEAAFWLRKMTYLHPEYIAEWKRLRIKLAVVSRSETVVSVPEYRGLKDIGARGGGATEYYNATTTDEANLMCAAEGGGYGSWGPDKIMIHELAHSIHLAIKYANPPLHRKIADTFAKPSVKALWVNTYANTNVNEYFAEISQSWFGANRRGPAGGNGTHNDLSSRGDLLARDPDSSALMLEVYGNSAIEYQCPN